MCWDSDVDIWLFIAMVMIGLHLLVMNACLHSNTYLHTAYSHYDIMHPAGYVIKRLQNQHSFTLPCCFLILLKRRESVADFQKVTKEETVEKVRWSFSAVTLTGVLFPRHLSSQFLQGSTQIFSAHTRHFLVCLVPWSHKRPQEVTLTNKTAESCIVMTKVCVWLTVWVNSFSHSHYTEKIENLISHLRWWILLA